METSAESAVLADASTVVTEGHRPASSAYSNDGSMSP
jgi:hypothetical protein